MNQSSITIRGKIGLGSLIVNEVEGKLSILSKLIEEKFRFNISKTFKQLPGITGYSISVDLFISSTVKDKTTFILAIFDLFKTQGAC
ncbi:MAG TPA: hypothetical protein EYO86_01870 [Pelagibacterales bacterium]|nr:hypothetical protein [Pelagibacterales bacterium]